MTISLYDASIPVFRRYLGQLGALLGTVEVHARSHGLDMETLLQSRLAPDMLPFATQVEIAANFALRACFPLAGLPLPPYGDFEPTIDGLRARLNDVTGRLDGLDPLAFAANASRVIDDRAGNTVVSLDASSFLFQYALPNFFFHVSMAYAILRKGGIPLGKANFDGFHVYGS